ncbi:MAG: DMT family transporter [Rhodoferax sp.]|nr:DMT family transporter [Rhodoferax sp.]
MPATPSRTETAMLIVAAMLAFAGNSLLCRLAFKTTSIDPASYTTVRLVAGAAMLWLLQLWRVQASAKGSAPTKTSVLGGDWISATALFVYAALLSWSYGGMSTATGALLLFGAVQACMVGWGIYRGERLAPLQWGGLLIALAGLVLLMAPGLEAPAWGDSLAMLGSGLAWGVYSLLGKRAGADGRAPDATRATAGNFVRTVPMTLALSLFALQQVQLDPTGLCFAMASGAVTSGLGYAIWYRALPALQATQAASIQLCVPVLAAIGGVLFVNETFTLVLGISSVAILGGIALVLRQRR